MASSLRGLLPAASASSRAGPLESGLGAGSGSDARAQPPPDGSASVSARRPSTPPRASSACSGRRSAPRPNPGPDPAPSTGHHAGAGRGGDRSAAGSQRGAGVGAGGAGVAAGGRGALGRREGDAAPLLSSAGAAGRRRWGPTPGRLATVRPLTPMPDHRLISMSWARPKELLINVIPFRVVGMLRGLQQYHVQNPARNSPAVTVTANMAVTAAALAAKQLVPATGGCIAAARAAWEADAVMLDPHR